MSVALPVPLAGETESQLALDAAVQLVVAGLTLSVIVPMPLFAGAPAVAGFNAIVGDPAAAETRRDEVEFATGIVAGTLFGVRDLESISVPPPHDVRPILAKIKTRNNPN